MTQLPQPVECPWCGVLLRSTRCMDHIDEPDHELPPPGARMLCFVCSCPLVALEGGGVRKLLVEELLALPQATQVKLAAYAAHLMTVRARMQVERGQIVAQPVGIRVGAMRNADKEKVYLYGWGVYEGDFLPDEAAGFGAELARAAGRTNPRIRLDDGTVVYGCECWWGPAVEVEASIQGRQIEMVSIDEARAMWHAEKAEREGQEHSA